VIGSLSNGLNGDNTVLVLKAAIDGLAAIALTSSFGVGVGFSSLPIFLYQGGLSLATTGTLVAAFVEKFSKIAIAF